MRQRIAIILEQHFELKKRGSDLRYETIGGITTFMTLAYIVFVQPVVLSAAGMDFGAVLMATCLVSAFATMVMGLYANYPVALAPAMGHNFYFAFAVVLGMQIPWQTALAATFAAGLLFLVLTLSGLREKIMLAFPASLNNAIGSGIGLLITIVGLQWSGLVVDHPGTLVAMGNLSSPPTLLALFGLLVTSVLLVRGFPGAILIGIVTTAIVGILTGLLHYRGLVSAPPSISPTAFQLDLESLFSWQILSIIIVFLFLDVFDTIGTLVGIAPEAGLIKNGQLVDGKKAFIADATGTVAASLLGTSTITSYVESAAGVNSGARTGLSALVTALLLLVTPFFYPLIQMIGGGIKVSESLTLYPVTAPALVIIGVMMMKSASKIPWNDPAEAIPAFLTITIMSLTISITEGIAFGIISYSILSFFSKTSGKVNWILHFCAILLLLRYVFLV